MTDKKTASKGAAGAKRLLLIEDEEALAELLRAKLVEAGFTVILTYDGISGFQLIKKTTPDLVLLDMMIPGMDGFAVLEKMKAEGLLPATPVLIISNSGQPIEIERAMRLGVRDYLIKVNFDPHVVVTRVQSILHSESKGGRETHPSAAGGTADVRILIVEDDLLLVGILESKFLKEGYAVYKALDVEQARWILETQAIDIILLDIVLPGVDGLTFLRELKEKAEWKEIPVVVISNLGQREEIEKGIQAGAADYIVKANVSPTQIAEKVKRILNP